MTQRVDHENRTILNFEDKHVAKYQVHVLNQLYHFKEAQVKVTPEWLHNKDESVDFLSIMKGWWSEGNFRSKPTLTGLRTLKLRKTFKS